jgi:hypothetical protein
MKKSLFTLFLVTASLFAKAQSDSTDAGKFTISGYLDSYYLTAFNSPRSGTLMGRVLTEPNGDVLFLPAGRAFDRLDKQFALGLVQTKFAYTSNKSEMVIDLTFGPNAQLGNFGNTTNANLYLPANGYVNALYGTSAAIKQAYFTYKATPKLSFTVGQFGTHIGYEVIDAPVNYHYSLSNLFNNGPFYHVGAKASYAFSDKAGLMLGVVNNWDNLTDSKTQKSLVGQFFFKPADTWSVYLNYIGGYSDDTYLTGRVNNAPSKKPVNPVLLNYTRQMVDLTTSFQVTDKFYLGLNAAYGFYSFSTGTKEDEDFIKGTFNGKTSPDWGGVAFYTNYAVSDVFGIGVRYEHFQDKNAARYLQTVNNSLTVTTPISLAAGKLKVKPELRIDTATNPYYEDASGALVNSQTTLGVAFIYSY